MKNCLPQLYDYGTFFLSFLLAYILVHHLLVAWFMNFSISDFQMCFGGQKFKISLSIT